jgi:hypothetical protein
MTSTRRSSMSNALDLVAQPLARGQHVAVPAIALLSAGTFEIPFPGESERVNRHFEKL